MEDKRIIDFISNRMNILRTDLIEKDIILTKILNKLSAEKEFLNNYAFKGGTCIIKCYLGYYRFSEDLDFTYISQDEFKDKSEGKIREEISNKIDKVAKILEVMSSSLGLRFKADKKNADYFTFGGGNAFVTMKLWYTAVDEKEAYIKVQINYKEKLEFPIKEIEAKSVISKEMEKDFVTNFKDEAKFLIRPIRIKAYDLKEILIEKVRAILTRRGVKARDFIDIYEITNSEKLDITHFKQGILEKTRAMLRFDKYKDNLDKKKSIDLGKEIKNDRIKMEEESIMLKSIHANFDSFLDKFKIFVVELSKEV